MKMSKHRTIDDLDLIQTEAEYHVSLLRPEINLIPATPVGKKVKSKKRTLLGSQDLNASPVAVKDTPKGVRVLDNIKIVGPETAKRRLAEKAKVAQNFDVADNSFFHPAPHSSHVSDTTVPGQSFKPLAGSTPAVVAPPERKTRSRKKRSHEERRVSVGNVITGEMWDDEDEDREVEEYFRRKIDKIGRMIQKWKKFVRDNGLPEDYYEHLFD